MIAYPNLIVDLDGVVYLDAEEIPGAGAFLRRADGAGCTIVFATNNASRPAEELADRIRSITGYDARVEQIVSSAMAAASLVPAGSHVFCAAGPGVEAAVAASGSHAVADWSAADAVVVGFDRSMTYTRLRDAALAIRSGALFIAANADPTFPTPEGLWPGAGASISFLQTATDREPDAIAGKPNEPIRRLLAEKLTDGAVLVIGDRPETDLAVGIEAGWDTALVLSGVVDDPIDLPEAYTPTYVRPTLADLGDVIGV